VTIADAELSNAVAALKNGQIDGFVTAGSYPAPNVIEAAAGTFRMTRPSSQTRFRLSSGSSFAGNFHTLDDRGLRNTHARRCPCFTFATAA
jgi:hypothetical protein